MSHGPAPRVPQLLGLVLLAGLALPQSGAAVDVSPPAPLTATDLFHEIAPHISGDGSRLVFSGWHGSASLSWPSNRFSLSFGACGGQTAVPVSTNDSVGAYGDGSDEHPTISADGTRIAWSTADSPPDTVTPYSTWFSDAPESSPVLVKSGIVIFPYDSRGSLGPRTHLSGDGRWLFHVEQLRNLGAGGVWDGSQLIRTDLDDPALGECVVSSVDGLTLAASHRSVSADGSKAVVTASWPTAPGVHLLEHVSGCTFSDALITADPAASNATMSADGDIVAWTSNHDACDPLLPALFTTDLWIWMENGATLAGMTESCTLVAPHPLAGSTLNRFPGPGVADGGGESRASVSGDGSTIAFLSDGDLSNTGSLPAGIDQVWAAVLGASAVTLEQITFYTEDLFHSPAPASVNATVADVSITDHGESVVYAVRTGEGTPRRDMRLVNLEEGPGVTLIPEPVNTVRAAALPFEVEMLDCTADGTEVEFNVKLRQFRGGDRQLVMQLEVEDGSGVVHRRAPFVQLLEDEKGAILIESVESEFTAGTCRVTAHDGGVTDIDRVSDSRAID